MNYIRDLSPEQPGTPAAAWRTTFSRLGYSTAGLRPARKCTTSLLSWTAEILRTGSYNWTSESEEKNYENLLILREPAVVEEYQKEFEALWSEAEKNS
ncbi:MAG: phospholipase D-like domain-containing protein [Terriglobia bacterium]